MSGSWVLPRTMSEPPGGQPPGAAWGQSFCFLSQEKTEAVAPVTGGPGLASAVSPAPALAWPDMDGDDRGLRRRLGSELLFSAPGEDRSSGPGLG